MLVGNSRNPGAVLGGTYCGGRQEAGLLHGNVCHSGSAGAQRRGLKPSRRGDRREGARRSGRGACIATAEVCRWSNVAARWVGAISWRGVVAGDPVERQSCVGPIDPAMCASWRFQ